MDQKWLFHVKQPFFIMYIRRYFEYIEIGISRAKSVINDLICIYDCSIQPSLCILQHINKLHSSSQNDSTDLL